MKSFTLTQLQFANEVCFINDFTELFKKHAEGTDYEDFYVYETVRLKQEYKGNLLHYIASFSRHSLVNGPEEIFNRILTDLIGVYK